MYQSMIRGFCVVGVLAGMQAAAWADDIVPAPWRGEGLYTYQEWDFHNPGPITPDGDAMAINPNGEASVTPGNGVTWTPGFNGGALDGYVGSGGPGSFLDFNIPNFIDFEPIKRIRIQINGIWDTTPAPFVSGIQAEDNEVGTDVSVGLDGSDETFPGFHRWEDWHIIPNPNFEIIQVFIPEGSFVNQVVIETTSFPEPTSLGLLAVSGMMMLVRRRG